MSSRPERSHHSGFGFFQNTETAARTSALSLFEPEIIEKSVRERKECIVRPTSFSETGPIFINVPPEGDYYIDPASFEIHGDFIIEKWDTSKNNYVPLTDDDKDKVAPISMFTKAFWRDIEVYINQQQISLVATTAYPIKAYWETVLSYGENAANTLLATSHYFPATPGSLDGIGSTGTNASTTFAARHEVIKGSKIVRMCDVLHSEISTMDRYLLPGLTLDFRFSINKSSVFLMHAHSEVYRVKFIDCYLKFDRLLLHESMHKNIENHMKNGGRAIYPINRSTVRTKQVPSAEVYARWQNLYSGTLPDDILICMIDSRAFNGASNKNIFNFQHFNLAAISLKVNSQMIPVTPLTCDFSNGDCLKAYKHMFNNLGIKNSNSPCLITYEKFLAGSTLIPFDLTPDGCSSYHSHEKKTGTIELDIRFKEALPTGITLVAICNFSDKIVLTGSDNQREIHINPELQG